MAETSSSNQQPCALRALPPELRNRIWEYALPTDTIISPAWAHAIEFYPSNRAIRYRKVDSYGSNTKPPGLTQTNRQIRRETRPIYLANNTFVFHLFREADIQDWRRWNHSILRVDACHLRNMRLYGIKYCQGGHTHVHDGGNGTPVVSLSDEFLFRLDVSFNSYEAAVPLALTWRMDGSVDPESKCLWESKMAKNTDEESQLWESRFNLFFGRWDWSSGDLNAALARRVGVTVRAVARLCRFE